MENRKYYVGDLEFSYDDFWRAVTLCKMTKTPLKDQDGNVLMKFSNPKKIEEEK